MGGVTIKTHYDVYDPLDKIPKEEWHTIVLRKAHHVKQILNTNLDDALDILNDLEEHEAWAATEMQKDFFFRITCGVPPEDLWKVRAVQAFMREKGQQCPSSFHEALTVHEKVEKAKFQAHNVPQGTRTDLSQLPYLVRKLSDGGGDGGNSQAYLLRKLARDHPDILEAYKRGEYKSARSAAKAAGIKVQLMVDLMGKPKTIAARILAQGDDFVTALLKALNEPQSCNEIENDIPVLIRRPEGDGHYRSKAVITPAGRFGSIGLASKHYGISRGAGLARVRKETMGWRLER